MPFAGDFSGALLMSLPLIWGHCASWRLNGEFSVRKVTTNCSGNAGRFHMAKGIVREACWRNNREIESVGYYSDRLHVVQ